MKVLAVLLVTLASLAAGCSLASDVTPPPAEEIAEVTVADTAEFESPVTVAAQETHPATDVLTQPATNVPTPSPTDAPTQGATDLPTGTSTASLTNTPTALPTNTAMPAPKIVPTIPAIAEMKWEEISPPVGVEYEGANWIKIQAPRDRTILAAYFIPEGEGPFPVVVILHGTMGLREIHVQLAQDYAGNGFIAVAGSWFGGHYKYAGGKKPPVETEHSDGIDWTEGPDIKVGSHPEAVEDVVAFVEAARTLPSADPRRIGLYGHSRGSTAAIATAASGIDIRAVVAVAGYPTKLSFRKLEAPMLLLQGTEDKLIQPADALQFKEKLNTLGKTVMIHIVDGAPHDAHTTLPWSTELRNRASSFYSEYLENGSAGGKRSGD